MPNVTDVPQSSPPRSALPAFLGVVAALAGNLFAQSAVSLPQDTPFFKDPGTTRLGTLLAGARVAANRTSGGYSQVILDGWIFTASTRTDQREGHDLSIRIPEGENVRDAPNGAIVARAVQGTLFRKVSASGGWTRVIRAVWVPEPAVSAARRHGGPAAGATAARREDGSAAGASAARRQDGSAARDSAGNRNAEPPAEPPSDARLATLRSSAILSRAPDGAGLAKLLEPAEVSIGEVRGEWVRVRLEGWVRRGEVDSAVTPRPAITGLMLRENPDRYVGQTVDWRVQFLALQQADELRPEMPAGQPYLLVRGPLPESGFAYVKVSKAQAEELKGLHPLEELGITVIVRAGRTRYLATPIVELVRRTP
jgi:hypothetical protein